MIPWLVVVLLMAVVPPIETALVVLSTRTFLAICVPNTIEAASSAFSLSGSWAFGGTDEVGKRVVDKTVMLVGTTCSCLSSCSVSNTSSGTTEVPDATDLASADPVATGENLC
jgi:hypothetical protein